METKIIKILLTLFVAILIPVYWLNYGPSNFLWLSDIGLFLTVLALWFESPLLISIPAIGILPVEIAWNIDFFTRLITGYTPIGIADYMFDQKYSIFLRSLSLFHIVLPIIWIWYLHKWGYDRRAFFYMTLLGSAAFITTYVFTDPQANINWIFNPIVHHWQINSLAWLMVLLISFPLFIFLPMHFLLSKLCK